MTEKLKCIGLNRLLSNQKMQVSLLILGGIIFGGIVEYFTNPRNFTYIFFLTAILLIILVSSFIKKKYLPCPYCNKSVKISENWQCPYCNEWQGKECLLNQKCKHCNRKLETAYCEHCHKEFRL